MTPLQLQNRFDKATRWSDYLIPSLVDFAVPPGPLNRLRWLPLKCVMKVMEIQLLILKNL